MPRRLVLEKHELSSASTKPAGLIALATRRIRSKIGVAGDPPA